MSRVFEVKESAMINRVMLIIFSLIIIGVIATAVHAVWLILVLPVFYFFVFLKNVGASKKILMRIDPSGIYYNGILLCDWNSFKNAWLSEEEEFRSLETRYHLLIDHYRQPDGALVRTTIKIGNTWDRSGEEIIEAMKIFYQSFRN